MATDSAGTSIARRVLLALGLLAVLGLAGFAWQSLRIELRLTSEPAGASVRLDGERVGTTPLAVGLTAGRHLLTLDLDGRAQSRLVVDAVRGDRLERNVVLERGAGRLTLLSNPRGAWVEVEGERLADVTPLEHVAPSGQITVRMGLDERRPVERSVLLLDGAALEVRIELPRDPHGALTVDVAPVDAQIRLPELDVAYLPGVRVPVGRHLVEVARSGFESVQTHVDVTGAGGRASVVLERLRATLDVVARPANAQITIAWREFGSRAYQAPWTPELRVPLGEVLIRGRALGHRTAERRVDHGGDERPIDLVLERIDVAAGTRMRDTIASGGEGPALVVIPAGRFVMGQADGPPSLRPARTRVLATPFAMSVHEVTVGDYARFTASSDVRMDERLVHADDPVRWVDHEDAIAYAQWLSRETGEVYRLPTEAEWEYAARAGTVTDFWFGDAADMICRHANLADESTRALYDQWDAAPCDDGHATVAPVGSFDANAFGLHDVLGNVSEWVLECGMPSYADADEDGTIINRGARCSSHGHRGGSWDGGPDALRVARRAAGSGRKDDVGIRLVREL